MVIDPVLIATKAVARVQHRRVLVGEPGQFIEPAAGQRAEAIEVRLQPLEIVGGQIEPQQIVQAAIGGVKILPGAVRRDVVGTATRDGRLRLFRRCPG